MNAFTPKKYQQDPANQGGVLDSVEAYFKACHTDGRASRAFNSVTEALWGAKINPQTKVRYLTDEQLRELLIQAKIAMEKSLAAGGSTMKNYVRADGTKGNYLDLFANVFRREGLPCPRCGTEIVKIKVGGRGTHFCPKCQKK